MLFEIDIFEIISQFEKILPTKTSKWRYRFDYSENYILHLSGVYKSIMTLHQKKKKKKAR